MAVIPQLCGTVQVIDKLTDPYYGVEVTLVDCKHSLDAVSKPTQFVRIPRRYLNGPDKIPFAVGDRVAALAFSLPDSGHWEAEGFTVMKKGF